MRVFSGYVWTQLEQFHILPCSNVLNIIRTLLVLISWTKLVTVFLEVRDGWRNKTYKAKTHFADTLRVDFCIDQLRSLLSQSGNGSEMDSDANAMVVLD